MKESPVQDELDRLLKNWWLIAFLAMMGGLAGWLIGMKNPPLYEGRASMVVYIDSARQLRGSQNDFNMMIGNVSALVSPRALGHELIEASGGKCEEINISALTMERRDSLWDFLVRCTDPDMAAALANTWVEKAQAILDEAYSHGLRYDVLTANMDLLRKCREDPTRPVCLNITDLNTAAERIDALHSELETERQASQGISTALVYRIDSYASVPSRPSVNAPGTLIAAGAFLGMLVGYLCLRVPFKAVREKGK